MNEETVTISGALNKLREIGFESCKRCQLTYETII
jgi:hypothetical protein